jgi:hypothetical protein
MPTVVYAVECSKNGFTYVGYSADYKRRWRAHRRMLRRGLHSVRSLTADWQKYGEQAFALKVLEVLPYNIDLSQARDAELHWQDRYARLGRLYNERKCPMCGSAIGHDTSLIVEPGVAGGDQASPTGADCHAMARPAEDQEPAEAADRQPRRKRQVSQGPAKRRRARARHRSGKAPVAGPHATARG